MYHRAQTNNQIKLTCCDETKKIIVIVRKIIIRLIEMTFSPILFRTFSAMRPSVDFFDAKPFLPVLFYHYSNLIDNNI